MEREDLDQFLAAVRRPRFLDYLDPIGETPLEAFERRLHWADRAQDQPGHEDEAYFLLNNEAALRELLVQETTTETAGDDWVEAADAGDEDGQRGWSAQRISTGAAPEDAGDQSEEVVPEHKTVPQAPTRTGTPRASMPPGPSPMPALMSKSASAKAASRRATEPHPDEGPTTVMRSSDVHIEEMIHTPAPAPRSTSKRTGTPPSLPPSPPSLPPSGTPAPAPSSLGMPSIMRPRAADSSRPTAPEPPKRSRAAVFAGMAVLAGLVVVVGVFVVLPKVRGNAAAVDVPITAPLAADIKTATTPEPDTDAPGTEAAPVPAVDPATLPGTPTPAVDPATLPGTPTPPREPTTTTPTRPRPVTPTKPTPTTTPATTPATPPATTPPGTADTTTTPPATADVTTLTVLNPPPPVAPVAGPPVAKGLWVGKVGPYQIFLTVSSDSGGQLQSKAEVQRPEGWVEMTFEGSFDGTSGAFDLRDPVGGGIMRGKVAADRLSGYAVLNKGEPQVNMNTTRKQ